MRSSPPKLTKHPSDETEKRRAVGWTRRGAQASGAPPGSRTSSPPTCAFALTHQRGGAAGHCAAGVEYRGFERLSIVARPTSAAVCTADCASASIRQRRSTWCLLGGVIADGPLQ